MDEQPPITSRALLVYLVGRLDRLEARMDEVLDHQRTHTFEVRTKRWLTILAIVLEWRATALAAGMGAIGWLKFWKK